MKMDELREVLADAPNLSKYHGVGGFEAERFIADYEQSVKARFPDITY